MLDIPIGTEIAEKPPSSGEITAEVAEKIRLLVGYCVMLRERYPISNSVDDCSSEESAYFLSVEKEYLRVPEHLQYQNLESQIAPDHRPSIKAIWDELIVKGREFRETFMSLQERWEKWTEFPRWGFVTEKLSREGRFARQTVNEYPIPIPPKHKKGIIHTATPAFRGRGEKMSRLRRWQKDERSTRLQFEADHREYMVTLRIYYELLLEENHDGTATVISYDNPLREEISYRNNMVRIINTSYQCIQIAKGMHNEQDKGRLRKHEGIPYAMHTLKVTLAALMDTLPFITDWDEASIDPILLAAVSPIHDTVEDTALTLQTVLNKLAHGAEAYDTSIDPIIVLNFKHKGAYDSVEGFKKRRVNLINRPYMLKKIEAVLRILTDSGPGGEAENDAPLDDRETAIAIQQNLFGEEQTLYHLGLLSAEDLQLPEDQKREKIRLAGILYRVHDHGPIEDPCETADQFPKDHDRGKLTRFLIRANAIASGDKKKTRDADYAQMILQHALIIKFNDRANNLITKPSDDEKQRISKIKDLRNAVERLISWAIYDYDNDHYPLYNALPRLINTCLMVYRELQQTHPEMIKDVDRDYIHRLEIWAKGVIEITRFKTNSQVHAVMEEFAEAKKHTPKLTRGSIHQFEQQQTAHATQKSSQ